MPTSRSRARFVAVALVCALGSGTALAQMDFTGEWPVVRAQDNVDNPHLGEYVGLPLSPEAIRRAEIWDASIQSLPEWQCRPHSGVYIKRGPSSLRIWKEVDPASRAIVAFQAEWLRSTSTPISRRRSRACDRAASLIVCGDRDLLVRGTLRNIRILDAADALAPVAR